MNKVVNKICAGSISIEAKTMQTTAIKHEVNYIIECALSDHISFVKELLTFGIGCSWTLLILVLYIILKIPLMP